MAILNLVGLDGYSFQIDTKREFWMDGVSDLIHLKSKVCSHLRNNIKEQIYNELNIPKDAEIGDVFDEFKESPLFKKWLNVNKTRYIQLIFNDAILDDENFDEIDLQSGDTLNYVILSRD